MEQFPFAVDNPDSPIVAGAAGGDDSSSLVTASSQGSFVPTSEDDHVGGMMHSSLQQHTDDENDPINNHNHDAVFANLTHQHATPETVQQPHLLPVEPINFGATIVELPPPSPQILSSVSHQALPTTMTRPPPVVNTSTSTIPPPSTLLSGVDVLKSAGSRVTSVLSNLGYNLGMNNSNTNGSSAVTSATAPTIRISNTTPVSKISKQHYERQPESHSPKNIALEEGTNDFAYINVTDEDEVDVWLDENHANTYREDTTIHVNTSPGSVRRGNILAVLLANDTSPPLSSVNDKDAATTPPMTSPVDQLVQCTEQANQMTSKAVDARKNGNLQAALDRHSDAAKLYHQAALQVRDRDGT